MDRFLIQGGVPLEGEIAVSGAKNSALPALAACLLTSDPVTLARIPPVRDIATMQKLITHTGAKVTQADGRVTIEAGTLDRPEAPYELVKTMRASSLVLGPLVARCGRARVSCPAAAPSARGPSICTSPAWNAGRARCARSTATSKPRRRTGLQGAEVHVRPDHASPGPRIC